MGEVFAGRYELADPIGRGGVGAVWRAWDHRRRRFVAAKVLLQSDAHSLLRFVREQALRIDHPHVLAPASWAADDDKVLFTMDLVSGGSLVHLIGDYGPLPPAFVCTLLDQLLAGLAAVHGEGVVHRDIKPANILLEATGTGRPRLRLSDFGIAMRLGEPRLTETNLVVGTPGYLAPEQMMGAEPDFPADLFAVGLVALYLLEGAKPDAKALIQYFAAHGTPNAPQSVPDPLWQVVASLLQPDPQARFRTATGARKALAAARELLPEPGPEDETIEIFDQLGPLPPGFGPEGPLKQAPGVDPRRTHLGGTGAGGAGRFRAGDGDGGEGGSSWPGYGAGPGADPRADGAGDEADGVPSWPDEAGGLPSSRREGNGVAPRPGEGGGVTPRPGESDGVIPRPGEAGGASSWFGEGNGVSSQPRGAAVGGVSPSSSRPGGGGGAGSFPPGGPDGAASQPAGRSSGSWHGGGDQAARPGAEGGEAAGRRAGTEASMAGDGIEASQRAQENSPPWRGDLDPQHWSGEANPPSWPAEAPSPSWLGEANSPSWPGEANSPAWSAEANSPSWPGQANPDPWPGPANQPSWPGQAPPSPWPGQTAPPSRAGDTNPPLPPGTPPFASGSNAPSARPTNGTGAGAPVTDTPSPTSAPGTDSGAPWSAHHTPPAPSGPPPSPPPTPETGSFPLPPPQSPEHQAHRHQPRPQAQAHSAYVSPHDPTPSTHVLPSPHPHAPRFPPHQLHADTSTASYTAQTPQVPPPARRISRARRSGPPAKVAIPLLFLALACYAMGFWALTQI